MWNAPQENDDEKSSGDASDGVLAGGSKKRDFYKIDKTENRLRMRKCVVCEFLSVLSQSIHFLLSYIYNRGQVVFVGTVVFPKNPPSRC